MHKSDINVGLFYMEGTNCDNELYHGFKMQNVNVELIPINKISKNFDLMKYHVLMIPGGFSGGDYIRAGALFSARLKHLFQDQLKSYIKEGRIFGGICNGFQVLIELGLLPGFEKDFKVEAALTNNESNKFECRLSILSVNKNNNSPIVDNIKKDRLYSLPVAHAEGNFVIGNKKLLNEIEDNNMVIFRYVNPEGKIEGYPWNPNGSINNIAGISNKEGNVFGLMPHPERVLYRYTSRNWIVDQSNDDIYGDGWYLINSIVSYAEKKF
ncbi:MAG: phosphoribosylformylglycinamidine synthase subunit PurQ [Thermoplasmata archaeon]